MKIVEKDSFINNENTPFGKRIQELFTKIRPVKIIETGTYMGMGSTLVIAKVIKSLKLDSIFFSIEVNPEFCNKAKENLGELAVYVTIVNGLSIPHEMLPTTKQIKDAVIIDNKPGIFVDHKENERINLYKTETDFNNVPDDMLKICLEKFRFSPDFVLLDSGGHVGNIEFNHLISLLRGTCFIALDDIFHVKHYKSFKQIQNNPEFEWYSVLKDGTGHCISKFVQRVTE